VPVVWIGNSVYHSCQTCTDDEDEAVESWEFMTGPLNYASGSSIFYALSLPCFATTTMSSFYAITITENAPCRACEKACEAPSRQGRALLYSLKLPA
jgi:hypothetical protein